MSLPKYQVVVLDPTTGSLRYLFDVMSFYELRYSRALNDVGVIAMTIPSTLEIRTAFTLDAFIEVYREDDNGNLTFEETYLTRLTHRFIEGEVEKFVVGGLSLNHLLMRRIIDPDDDPLQSGGFSTKAGRADTVIAGYVNEQIGSLASAGRSVSSLVISTIPRIGGSVGARLRHENLFKKVQELAKQGAVDFTIRRAIGNNLELTLGALGTDRTRSTNETLGKPWVGLTPLRGNLTLPSLVRDRKEEANYIYALGQGQRDKRIVYKAAGTGTGDSPFNRCEFAEDIRNIQKSDVLGLVTGAGVALKEKLVKREFSYQPTNEEPGNSYRTDWDLGDAVTTVWDEDEFDLRITQVEVAVSAEGETISATVTDDFQFPGTANYYGALPLRGTGWKDSMVPINGGAYIYQVQASQPYRYIANHTTVANGNSGSFSVWLREGTYTMFFLGITTSDQGILDWYFDGEAAPQVSSQDWYSAGTIFNILKQAQVRIVGTGYHKIRYVVNGKNPSSTNYITYANKFWLEPLAD